jgi:hypothetical protein
MRQKHCDAIILNRPETMGSDDASIRIKRGDEPWSEPRTDTKARIGHVVVEMVEELVGRRPT